MLNFSFRYGWHFPELGKIITDNLAFVRTVELMGTRENAKSIDLSDVLPEEVEEKVKEAAEISMGTEISGEDIINIKHLCQQVSDCNLSIPHCLCLMNRWWKFKSTGASFMNT